MSYELAIRPRGPEGSIAEEAILGILRRAAAEGLLAHGTFAPLAAEPGPEHGADQAQSFSLPNGGGVCRARLARPEGQPRGADLEIAFGGTEEEFRRFLAFAMGAAETVGGLVFDPQLGRELARASADDVVARWRQSQTWMVEVAGLYEDPRGMVELTPPPPLLAARSKFLLLVAGGFALLYMVVGALTNCFGE